MTSDLDQRTTTSTNTARDRLTPGLTPLRRVGQDYRAALSRRQTSGPPMPSSATTRATAPTDPTTILALPRRTTSLTTSLTTARAAKPVRPPLVRCNTCSDRGFLHADVAVGHPDFGRAIPCNCRLLTDQARLDERARAASNLSGQLLRTTFARFHATPDTAQLYDAGRAFAASPSGWLLLLGPCGVGKTHIMAAIANTLLHTDHPPLYVVVPDFLNYLRAGVEPTTTGDGNLERLQTVKRAGVLLLDDLGAQRRTEWGDEQLFELLNHRYNHALPTVISSNVRPQDMEPRIGSRLRDRALVHEVVVLAPDYRLHAPPPPPPPPAAERVDR